MTLGYGIRSRLEERLLSCLPAASFEMETLCRLAGIVESRAIETAAVECRRHPRLLVNPDFVAEHCSRDEHLFLLVMHELWHVILAHTRLYPRLTVAHNVAFDAVINAGLARQFPGPEYRGFLERINPTDSFPGCLLRPPAGWPAAPVLPDCGPPGTREIVARLYPDPEAEASTPTYQELLDLLASGACDDEGGASPEAVLLGGHGDEEHEIRALDDEVFGETVRRIVATWPPPPFPLGGRDSGGAVRDWETLLAPPSVDARLAFARLLRLALGRHPGARTRRRRGLVAAPGGLGVLPNAADRLRPSRQALGLPATLWTQTSSSRGRVPERPAAAHVYLDVSGSMQELLPELCLLLAPYVASGEARAFQFSTEVAPIGAAALRRGELETTLGTDIRCVFDHLLADPHVRRALFVTDGYTGTPGDDQRRLVEERRITVHLVLPAESAYRDDLEPVAHTVTVLPPLKEENPMSAIQATTAVHAHIAEDVFPGHPDRIADAIAERIVDEAVGFDPDALVGVEVAVHRESVFVTGCVAASRPQGSTRILRPLFSLDEIVRDEVSAAGYTGRWALEPRVSHDLDRRDFADGERGIRRFSDDQNIVVGYAEGSEATNWLPSAPYAARRLRERLVALRLEHPDRLGPDGKVLVRIDEEHGAFRWGRVNVSLHHAPGAGDHESLYRLVWPVLEQLSEELDAALPGIAAAVPDDVLYLNGAGDFSCGGTFGDNGLSGKKLVVDGYGPGVPIGGGALCGKDPHKVDRIGALAARQLAVRLVRDAHARSTRVTLGWLPGTETPDTLHALVDGEPWAEPRIRAAITVPDLSIEGTFRRLELAGVRWVNVMRRGYFGNRWAWE